MLLIGQDSHVAELYSDNSWGAPPELPERPLINPSDLLEVQDHSRQSQITVPASGSLAVQEYLRFNL